MMSVPLGLAVIFIVVVLLATYLTRYVARDRAIREMHSSTARRAQQLRDRHRG